MSNTGHKYGYARVSTAKQSLDAQMDELKQAGCEKIFTDVATGKNTRRSGFEKMMDTILSGDVVIVCKLDRIGRSLNDLINVVSTFGDNGVGFKVLNNTAIDTTTSTGKLIFGIFASVAEFERELILERTQAGIERARLEGRVAGRPVSITHEQIGQVTRLSSGGGTMSISAACKVVGIHRQSYYRLLRTSAEAMA